jgi:Ca2+-binding RTX toxin-like protein
VLQFLAPQDFEAGKTVFDVTVSVSDNVDPAVTQVLKVNLTDVNETAPPITGTVGNDTLRGTEGNDVILALEGNDTLLGLSGADLLDGGPGRDSYDGGDGDDTLVLRSSESSTDTFLGGAGFDTLKVAEDSTTVVLNGLRVTDIEAFDGSGRTVQGGSLADVFDFSTFTSVIGVSAILGQGGNDQITGNALTADRIEGGGGSDTLIWNGGNDTFLGGAGNDTFQFLNGFGSGEVTITDFDRSGDDVVRLVGFTFGDAGSAAALRTATTFTSNGALLDLDAMADWAASCSPGSGRCPSAERKTS